VFVRSEINHPNSFFKSQINRSKYFTNVPESGSSSSSSSVPAEEQGVSNGIPDFQLLKIS